jgi:MFS family permease
MRELEDRVGAWRDAGLLTDDQAAAIRAFEADRAQSGVSSRRSLAAEAVGYVGAALALGAIILLLRDVWPELVTGGRLTLIGLLTLLLAGAGFVLRQAERGPVQRLTSVLLTAAVMGVGWFAFVVADDLLGWREAQMAFAVGTAALVVALPLYLLRPRALPQVTLLGSVLIVVTAALSLPQLPPEPVWYSVTVATVGVAWLLLGVGGWLRPGPLAETLGAVVAVLALQSGSFEHRVLILTLGVAVAAALVALAVTTDRVHHLVVGAVGLFLFVPQLVFELFGDAIGAPATLLVIGLLLVLLAVGIGRARREVANRPAPPSGGQGSPEGTTGPAARDEEPRPEEVGG